MHTIPKSMSCMSSPEASASPSRDAGLLRVFTCGSVDDGKSTLIGRLLHDSRSLHQDQIDAVARASARRNAGGLDLSLLTDGLRAEREQGITIDVAYRFFATARRRFILADTPGHVQYTRNMATGASTADVAVLLIDARHGVVEQTRRHACVAALLGVSRLVICVNKMDLVSFEQSRFESIRSAFASFARETRPDGERSIAERAVIEYIPIAALRGDNVVERSGHMAYYAGPSLLELLEEMPVASGSGSTRSRMPVQYVLRPQTDVHHDYRGYAGRVAAGGFAVGEEIAVLPGGHRSRITCIRIGDRSLERCTAGQSVALELADDVDISRGDMLVSASDVDSVRAPSTATRLEAVVIWMDARRLSVGRRFILKHTTRQVPAIVQHVDHRLNLDTQTTEPASDGLGLNEIGRVRLRLGSPIVCDAYAECRDTGSFILVDEHTNGTVGAGLIMPLGDSEVRP